MSLLKKSTIGKSTSNSAGSSNLAVTVSLLSNAQFYDCIVDSGASHHITLCKNVLESINVICKMNIDGVKTLSGSKSEITQRRCNSDGITENYRCPTCSRF